MSLKTSRDMRTEEEERRTLPSNFSPHAGSSRLGTRTSHLTRVYLHFTLKNRSILSCIAGSVITLTLTPPP